MQQQDDTNQLDQALYDIRMDETITKEDILLGIEETLKNHDEYELLAVTIVACCTRSLERQGMIRRDEFGLWTSNQPEGGTD